MVPPASHRVSRVPWYSGSYLKNYRFNYVAITLYSGAFQLSSSTMTSSLMTCPQPQQSKLHWFGLFRVRSPLLTESNFFLFLQVLRCFSSPGCPPGPYAFGVGISVLLRMGSPIRRPPGRRMCAPRRGLSQLAASFIGSLCQGIRRAPVVSCGTALGPAGYPRVAN